MEMTQFAMDIPKDMAPYLAGEDALSRNVMLLYPMIRNGTISHGRAAEILGIHKADLIEVLESLGIPYLDQTWESLMEDLHTLDSVLGAPT